MDRQAPPHAAAHAPVETTGRRKPRLSAQPVEVVLVPGAWLTWRSLVSLTGFSETSLRRMKRTDATFPTVHRIGRAAARFKATEVAAWLPTLSRSPYAGHAGNESHQ